MDRKGVKEADILAVYLPSHIIEIMDSILNTAKTEDGELIYQSRSHFIRCAVLKAIRIHNRGDSL